MLNDANLFSPVQFEDILLELELYGTIVVGSKMPPSPAMRCSPGREARADNHKRGRSFEGGVALKQRDDDLALFNEVQNREKDNFLLQGNDDFDDIFANKLRHFSDYKLGINIPARGESSDLLHAEDEKNDYEWLITPPDTPLFPSLDDEVPQVNLAQRGRTRTQPISISRTSTMEKGRRSSRGSASPNRVSLSPRSHNSTFEGRGRASSAPSASPPLTISRHTHTTTTPLRSSPPSRKPVPPPRASTPPPPRRLSTGSNSNGAATARGGIRGNSASPKVKAWQSSIPGFSTEVPPNLRTSLADRPASYVRGSSPAASRSSRQSMSPTASRSIGSPHSHERDRFSSHSKGSVGSSADDDMEMESFSSVVVGRQHSRRVGGFQNNKASPSKKPSRIISSSSAPKRSFDLALRQMDHKKGQNMFRPLLSSVPSSTFHAGIGIASSGHHPMISRNSSVTTSSNASSGVAISGAHDQDDATSRYVKVQQDHDDDEVFVMEKDDGNDPLLDDSRTITDRDPANLTTSDDISTQKVLLICSRCGCGYSPIGPENVTNLCVDCMEESNSSLTTVDHVTTITEPEAVAPLEPQMAVVESQEVTGNVKAHDELVKYGQSDEDQVNVDFTDSKVESLEVTGISILLKRSSSVKGAVVRNTNFSASSISYDDFSYVRDSTNSMRTTSVSVSSSVDFGQSKQNHQRPSSSSTKSEIEHSKHRHPSSIGNNTLDSFEKDIQENNDTCIENGNVNETHFDSGESLLLNNSLKVEEAAGLQKVDDSDTTLNKSCIDGSDVPLDAISEGEFDQSCSRASPPPSESDVSVSSTSSSIQELKEEVAVSGNEDYETCNHASNVIGESIVLIEDEGPGPKGGRSLALEEATDTILFCSSIVHTLAHNAATIAIQNQNPSDHPKLHNNNNSSWPLIPATRKSDLNKPDPTTKRTSRSRHKKDTETISAPTITITNTNTNENKQGKTDQPKTRVVGVRENGESKKPPLLESKCNCTIM